MLETVANEQQKRMLQSSSAYPLFVSCFFKLKQLRKSAQTASNIIALSTLPWQLCLRYHGNYEILFSLISRCCTLKCNRWREHHLSSQSFCLRSKSGHSKKFQPRKCVDLFLRFSLLPQAQIQSAFLGLRLIG